MGLEFLVGSCQQTEGWKHFSRQKFGTSDRTEGWGPLVDIRLGHISNQKVRDISAHRRLGTFQWEKVGGRGGGAI